MHNADVTLSWPGVCSWRPQLAAKNTIFFEQITNDISLVTVQPPGEENEHHLSGGEVDHGPSLYHDDHSCDRASIQSWDSTGSAPSYHFMTFPISKSEAQA